MKRYLDKKAAKWDGILTEREDWGSKKAWILSILESMSAEDITDVLLTIYSSDKYLNTEALEVLSNGRLIALGNQEPFSIDNAKYRG